MKRIYCCRCKKHFLGKDDYSIALFDGSDDVSFDEFVIDQFTLCETCKDVFVNEFMHKAVEEPHKIVNERVLLTEAAREDVRDYLIEQGIDEMMAFMISERVRKGYICARGWEPELMEDLKKASVPEWFIEACKNITYLSKRSKYRPPYLIDESLYRKLLPIKNLQRKTVAIRGITILTKDELEKNKQLVEIDSPFWVRYKETPDSKGRCGQVVGLGADGLKVYHREWGGVYPVLQLNNNNLEPGCKLLYARDEYIVLQDGIALCTREFRKMKSPLIMANTFEETPMMKSLNRLFEYIGDVAEVVYE